MVVIGITGSIGMGKTTVSNMLETLKIPVFDSDKKVKEIFEKNIKVRKKISKIWPDTVSGNHNQEKIDKVALSNKIFKSNSAKIKLENIIHPIVKKERTLFLKKFKGHSIVGLDVPLLYETGTYKQCDYIFLVNTTKNIQKKRVLTRPNMTEEKFELINDTQWSFKKKAIYGNPFVISTSYGKTVTFFIVLYYLFKIKLRGK
jgi:dephospho-CoA kinase